MQYIGKVGTVHRVTDKGDIRVQYEGCNNRWTFNPVVLHKVNTIAVGDVVSVITDVEKVKELQKGHGEWIEIMKNVSGYSQFYIFIFMNLFCVAVIGKTGQSVEDLFGRGLKGPTRWSGVDFKSPVCSADTGKCGRTGQYNACEPKSKTKALQ